MSFRQAVHAATGRLPAGSGEDRDAILVFLHIPKTAGSTLVSFLEREYGSGAVLDLYDSTFGDEATSLTPERLRRTRVVVGHFYFGVHEHLPRPCRYLTFLRDPVDRVVSHYRFVQRQPEHYLHETASTLSLSEYVRSCGTAEPNNDQTRLLAGRKLASGDGGSSRAMLPVAKRNLDRHAVVGLTEAFDASLLLMRRVFGWSRPFYVSRNIGDRREVVDPDTRGLILSHNELDAELYRYGRERFENEIREQGAAFARELRAFRRLNRVYGKTRALVSASRARRSPASA
ncbi:MAG TPA: sulfotransferase family 2 domain-containing protein [Gaiellaceae bacterium]|nr:sulfotransferase family 2 domain-containing protein [Gaiellaceae bacterium]